MSQALPSRLPCAQQHQQPPDTTQLLQPLSTGTTHNACIHMPGVWHMSASGPVEPDAAGSSNKVGADATS